MHREATDGDLDAAEEATEEEEATVLIPVDEDDTDPDTEDVETLIPLETAPWWSSMDLAPPLPMVEPLP